MSMTLAALTGAIALYFALRLVMPSWRDKHHAYDMDLAHVLMGTVMAAMFLAAAVPDWAHGPAITAFAVAAVWFAVRGLRDRLHAPLIRLSTACLAMLYMLAPMPAAATPDHAVHHTGHAHHMVNPGDTSISTLLGVAMVIGMFAVAVAAVIALTTPRRSAPERLSSFCELAKATAMGYMLALML